MLNLAANSGIETSVSGRIDPRASWIRSSTSAYDLGMLLRSYGDLKVADANLLQFCVGTVALSTPLHCQTPLRSKGVPTELARGGEVRSTSKARVDESRNMGKK